MPDLILSSVASKTCTRCGEVKEKSLFYKNTGTKDDLTSACKVCINSSSNVASNRSEETKERIRNYKRKWKKLNSQYDATYYAANSDVIKERAKIWKENNPERRLENNRRWALDNPEKSAECSRKNKARRMSEPLTAFIEKTRCLIGNHIRVRGYTKRSRTHEILGCSWDFFKLHIEKQFHKGMTWGNRSDWHIDHITPIAIAKTECEVLALNHFTNLRPIWAKDNLSKGAKITHLI